MSDVARLTEIVAEVRRTGDWNGLLAAIPYARFLGLQMDCSSGEPLGKLVYSDMLVGNPALPALHGGVIGALLESTAILTVLYDQQTVAFPKTVNVTVDYLRSAGPLDTWARARVTRQGRRVANVQVEAWQDDPARPVAAARCHLLLEPPDV